LRGLPIGKRLTRRSTEHTQIKLVAFDVDGTLLRGPTICECIAAGIGRSDEMRAIERLTSAKDIAAARAEMVSWYQCLDRATLLRFVESVTFAPGAREGVAALKRAGIHIALVSITWRFAVDWVASELGADFAIGSDWHEDGTIVHFWPDDKATWLTQCAARLGLTPAQFAVVGDSAGDMPMLRLARIGYFVGGERQDLPAHVRHWPGADIREIVRDILTAL
jgi:HAD superfamily phosphoserine phosphatase-like hydrolase